MSLGRKATGGLLIAGGVVVLASPLAAGLRLGLRARISAVVHRHDPVAPFCLAPCYERGPVEDLDTLTGHTEARP